MRLDPVPEPDGRLLGQCFQLHQPASLQALLSAYDDVPDGHRHLFTLDDLAQALYTAMHASHCHDLDSGDWLQEAGIAASWLQDGYPRDDLSLQQRLHIRRIGFERALEGVSFDDLFDKDLRLDDDSLADLVAANTDLLSVLDGECYLLRIPVQRACEAIYGFANGYFSSDLSPQENFRLAEHLEHHYGYALFGIGASFVAFRRSRALDEHQTASLLDLLNRLYAREDNGAQVRALFADSIANRELLVLRYTE
ncbi:hypothetical protein BVH03_19420 [Pseudomonas sp. PA15(2017)]|uniref:hypothetical protein n=1 Tax=Pseudomonas sp. PA15(2017) TaxID=1932111 RepID=UPI00096978D0|nr:hypothetical protein [Pseudomonas sp. PA15(2017)]OLU24755.1 hypothetical protein BVH03_19420 [Pseudomonas sp. PA15(2017)]